MKTSSLEFVHYFNQNLVGCNYLVYVAKYSRLGNKTFRTLWLKATDNKIEIQFSFHINDLSFFPQEFLLWEKNYQT